MSDDDERKPKFIEQVRMECLHLACRELGVGHPPETITAYAAKLFSFVETGEPLPVALTSNVESE